MKRNIRVVKQKQNVEQREATLWDIIGISQEDAERVVEKTLPMFKKSTNLIDFNKAVGKLKLKGIERDYYFLRLGATAQAMDFDHKRKLEQTKHQDGAVYR